MRGSAEAETAPESTSPNAAHHPPDRRDIAFLLGRVGASTSKLRAGVAKHHSVGLRVRPGVLKNLPSTQPPGECVVRSAGRGEGAIDPGPERLDPLARTARGGDPLDRETGERERAE